MFHIVSQLSAHIESGPSVLVQSLYQPDHLTWAIGTAQLGSFVRHMVEKENRGNESSVDKHKSPDVDWNIRLVFKPKLFKSGPR
ncbi:hypothetical protein FBY06_1443 [Pseudomonas sp. SJZ085]|nr:hypothetical protein FBX99_1443 [Pseudomonas sp. SJZ074]TWC30016.1 hypothetical protein FBY06_1443 [Pseudomonas sp. SJZ085]